LVEALTCPNGPEGNTPARAAGVEGAADLVFLPIWLVPRAKKDQTGTLALRHGPLNLLGRSSDQYAGKQPSDGEPAGLRSRGTRAGAARWYSGSSGRRVMNMRSGFWPDYDPLALVVLVVGILAITTWAVGF
jgi:hypothetical protein